MVRYEVGMYGGSFDPLHLGHIHDIIRAASECRVLYVMISWCEGRESTTKELRYRWILNSTKHLSNVEIIMIEDFAVSKEDYNTDYYWEKGACDIKARIGKKINVVYCGSDYLNTNRFESLYAPESDVIYFDRAEVPISSTQIREWAIHHWDYIPDICKPYYAKTVLLVGGESTGKSTLVENLARAYNTNYVEEVGRRTCEFAGGEEFMVAGDLIENLLRQKLDVQEALTKSNRLLFVDTDALTTAFYCNLLLTDEKEKATLIQMAESIHATNRWDMVLFLEPQGTDFIQDGTRNEEIREAREKYSAMLKNWFVKNKVSFYSIEGDYLDRFNQAKRLIGKELGITTVYG